MIQKSKLSISVHDAQFSRDYQYQISVQFLNQKQQTDVSALVRNPIFTKNTLFFDLPSNHTLQGTAIFVAHIILEDQQSNKPSKQTRILGQCTLDLTPFALQPTETYNLPIRQQIKFIRHKEGKQMLVGRFIASVKIVKEDNLPVFVEQLEQKRLERNQYFVELPDFQQPDFNWRIRLQIRQAYNLSSTEGIQPQVYVQSGWTQYQDTLPEQSRMYSTNILNSANPQWQQTILIKNPLHLTQSKGYVMVQMRDKNHMEDIFRIYLPLQSMSPFTPYNIKAIKQSQSQVSQVQFYFTAILEAPLSKKDKLHNIVIADITIQPMVAPFKFMFLALVVNSDIQPKKKFYEFDIKKDSIQRVLEFDEAQEFTYWLSQSMRIPPIKSMKGYRAASVFTVSETLLRKKISFAVVGKINRGQYSVAGIAENVQKDIVSLVIEKTKKMLFLQIRNHPNIKMGNCQLELTHSQNILSESQASSVSRPASQQIMQQYNISSNQSMFKHMSQNNQIISRILRDLDDKSQSLRQAAAEISDLRSRVKLLQNQNSILRKNATREEDQLINLVQREVENMSHKDLKQKIVKISQLYKAERVRTRQLDKTVKIMQPQISNTMQLNSIILSQKNTLQALTEKIEKVKKQNERINTYKETIKKQQKVIGKLEVVMREGMEEVRSARAIKLELEDMKKRGNMMPFKSSNRGEREEIQRLQGIIAQLQMKKSKTNLGYSQQQQNGSNYELEFKLHQAQTRINSLEEELQQKSKTYARELAMMRMKLAQKQAVMDGYRH